VIRTRAMMVAQAGQQRAKLAALDQQIAQKRAEADSLAATIDKLESGMPMLEQTADIRSKARQNEYGNVVADLDAQMKLSDQRHELIVQRRHAAEVEAARLALERQREQGEAEYAQGIVSDLADAEQKADELVEDLAKADKKIADQVLRAPIPASRRARSSSMRRASRSTARRCGSTTSRSRSRLAWR
jgi:hemolysin D